MFLKMQKNVQILSHNLRDTLLHTKQNITKIDVIPLCFFVK